jgi:hypothetical protein
MEVEHAKQEPKPATQTRREGTKGFDYVERRRINTGDLGIPN